MSDQTESSHLTGVDMSGIIALFHALADEHGRDVAEMIPPDLLPAIEALVEAKVRRARAASRMAEPQAERGDQRTRVAAALYRHSRVMEGIDGKAPDPEVYAGWFPWANLGSVQERWLRAADVAIDAMRTPSAEPNDDDDDPWCDECIEHLTTPPGVSDGAP